MVNGFRGDLRGVRPQPGSPQCPGSAGYAIDDDRLDDGSRARGDG